MRDKILKYLTALEVEKDIKILLACETGSRAWGFPSPDSDFDVRVIYVHRKDWYLSLNDRKDNIDLMFENNDIDISGWELRKSLILLRKSNAALLERIQSPIIYLADKDFLTDIKAVSPSSYSRISTMHHYLSMAKKFRAELDPAEDFKLKKFFYCLRSAMVSKWIAEMDQVPPIEFTKIYPNLGISETLVERIDELIELKKTISESYLHRGEHALFELIDSCMDQAEAIRQELPGNQKGTESLNQILRKYINRYDDRIS